MKLPLVWVAAIRLPLSVLPSWVALRLMSAPLQKTWP